ncbi:MAG: hypothetical protein ONB30_03670 [candidate division KSB1 bacterium]|nr:hypothetical protein [candidate division KSB1 bacterium]
MVDYQKPGSRATLRRSLSPGLFPSLWSKFFTPSLQARTRGSLLLGIGYLLSPLSWWNDAALNIPLAWVMASLVERLIPIGFAALFVAIYWLSNLGGMLLMHIGGKELFGAQFTGRKWLGVLATTVLYTAGILLLLKRKVLGPLPIQL